MNLTGIITKIEEERALTRQLTDNLSKAIEELRVYVHREMADHDERLLALIEGPKRDA
jgi:hypothetical protein